MSSPIMIDAMRLPGEQPAARSPRLSESVERARIGGRAAVSNQGRVHVARRSIWSHALRGRLHRLQDPGLLLVLHSVEIVESDACLQALGTVRWPAELNLYRDHPVVRAHVAGPLDVIVGAERAMAVSGRHVERLYDFEEHMIGPERRWSTLSTQRRGHRGCRLLLPQLKDR